MKKEQTNKHRITIQDKRASHGDNTAEEVAAEPLEVVEQGNGVETAPEVDWEQQAAEHLDLAQRKQAELDNFRKRALQEKDEARRNSVEALLYDLFPALDGLSQAAHAFKDRAVGEDPLLDGVRSTIRVLDSAFERHGIERISAAGVPFDSLLHQPLSVVESADVAVETVGEIYTEGYRVGDRILKPAMVLVLKPATEAEAETAD